MNNQDEFSDLIGFSGSKEAELLAELLKYGKLTFKLTKTPRAMGSLFPSSQAPIVIQVLNEDLKRAKELLSEYRKTEGVPFS
jgi:hypothetical protein